jgi:vanillate O-demethylase ferredoxin subunit
MAERLANVGADFEMHYCSRSLERTAFTARIADAPFAANVRFHFDNGPPEQRLDLEPLLRVPALGTHLYVCGPTGFMDHVIGSARQHGWADEQIHREYFSGVAPTHEGDTSFEVRIASTGRTVRIPADKTVVEALAEAGIAIATSCQQGVCGTCVTRVLEGEPDHRDMYFTDDEHAANDQFTPCCSRAKGRLLVLDL